jgi:hypothetical protein
MSQLALPFHQPAAPSPEIKSVKVSEGDTQSPEEKEMEAMSAPLAGSSRDAGTPPWRRRDARAKAPLADRGWPAALTWSEALAYSGISPAELRRWQKEGALRFRRLGPHRANVALRSKLDQLLDTQFDLPATDISEDFDFG